MAELPGVKKAAVLLVSLDQDRAAEILKRLPAEAVEEVSREIASLGEIATIARRDVFNEFYSLALANSYVSDGGLDTVAEILNLADRSTEKGIMEGLEAEDPDLVEQIRRLMFVFEDILLVNDKGIQSVLKEIDNEELALALKTASEELKQKIFKNMSERAAQLIQEYMQ